MYCALKKKRNPNLLNDPHYIYVKDMEYFDFSSLTFLLSGLRACKTFQFSGHSTCLQGLKFHPLPKGKKSPKMVSWV